jgi:hypothetical protein
MVAVYATDQEPLVLPARAEMERPLDETVAGWRRWGSCPGYDGPRPEAVARSAFSLKLHVDVASLGLQPAKRTPRSGLAVCQVAR